MSGPIISASVVMAAAPTSKKSCPKRVSFVVIGVNTGTGHVFTDVYADITSARSSFSSPGDPPEWKGLQIIRVET
jgi:hypothetical protein